MSLNPITLTSSGTLIPFSLKALITPIAISSDEHTTPSNFLPLSKNFSTALYPLLTFKSLKNSKSSSDFNPFSCNAFSYPKCLSPQALIAPLLTPTKAIFFNPLSIKLLVTSYVALTLSIITLGNLPSLSFDSASTVFQFNSFIISSGFIVSLFN